jgi:hypothetical protein
MVVGWAKLESGFNSLRRQDISVVFACLDRLLGPSSLLYDVEDCGIVGSNPTGGMDIFLL